MKLFSVLLSILFLTSAWAKDENEKEFSVAVTLSPYAKILHEIGGERVSSIVLIPAGSDPHSFEPKPSTLKDFSRAKIYFSDGSGMDKNWKPRFLGVNPSVSIVSLDEGIQWDTLFDNHAKELDPHLWTSPKMVKIIAQNMARALSKFDPAGESFYQKNLKNYLAQLDSLSEKIQTIVESLPENSKRFMVFHPSYGYLARDYGLEQLCIEAEGKEPKPKDLKRLIQQANESAIKTIFVMPQFSRRAAETIAKSIQGKVETTDPLAYEFERELLLLIQKLSDNKK